MYCRLYDMLWYSSQVQGEQAASVQLDTAMEGKGSHIWGNYTCVELHDVCDQWGRTWGKACVTYVRCEAYSNIRITHEAEV